MPHDIGRGPDRSEGTRVNSHDNSDAVRHGHSGPMGNNHTIPGTPAQVGNMRSVYSTVKTLVADGSGLTTMSFAHNLNFLPTVLASLNNTTVTTATDHAYGASLFLPTFVDGSVNGLLAGAVVFKNYLYHFTDATHVYVNFLNANGYTGSIDITFYLFQQTAAQ